MAQQRRPLAMMCDLSLRFARAPDPCPSERSRLHPIHFTPWWIGCRYLSRHMGYKFVLDRSEKGYEFHNQSR